MAAQVALRELVLVMGMPGAGKSTTVRRVIEGFVPEQLTEPLKHARFSGLNLVYLGVLRDKFPGTDGLAYAHQPILDFLEGIPDGHTVLAEGGRLTSANLLQKIHDMGFQLTIFEIAVDEDVRRTRVDDRDGREFKEQFLKATAGAIAKVKAAFPVTVLSGVSLEDLEINAGLVMDAVLL